MGRRLSDAELLKENDPALLLETLAAVEGAGYDDGRVTLGSTRSRRHRCPQT